MINYGTTCVSAVNYNNTSLERVNFNGTMVFPSQCSYVCLANPELHYFNIKLLRCCCYFLPITANQGCQYVCWPSIEYCNFDASDDTPIYLVTITAEPQGWPTLYPQRISIVKCQINGCTSLCVPTPWNSAIDDNWARCRVLKNQAYICGVVFGAFIMRDDGKKGTVATGWRETSGYDGGVNVTSLVNSATGANWGTFCAMTCACIGTFGSTYLQDDTEIVHTLYSSDFCHDDHVGIYNCVSLT